MNALKDPVMHKLWPKNVAKNPTFFKYPVKLIYIDQHRKQDYQISRTW